MKGGIKVSFITLQVNGKKKTIGALPTKHFSLRKEEIFERRRAADALRKTGISPMDIAHEIIKSVDPDLHETIEINKKFALEGAKSK